MESKFAFDYLSTYELITKHMNALRHHVQSMLDADKRMHAIAVGMDQLKKERDCINESYYRDFGDLYSAEFLHQLESDGMEADAKSVLSEKSE